MPTAGAAGGYGIMVLTVDGDRITGITGLPARCSSRTLASRRVWRDDVAYDETLASRIREVIGDIDGEVTERKMFGGLAFMLNGHMFTGVVGGELMLRLGDAGAEAALRREHVREMDFTGRPMKAMVFVQSVGLDGDALGEWVTRAAAFAQSLPPKSR
jgi:TfoX/Sxy family transcriptional regulator of competence genes